MILRSILKRPGRPTSYRVYWVTTFVLCLAGMGLSSYLAASHYRVHTDPGYQSFCAISKSLNCDTVSQSPFSVWLGLPLAVWGVALYGFIMTLVLFSAAPNAERRRVWTIIFTTGFFCSLSSVGLAFVSSFLIRSWCILCLATYGINLLLTFLSWIIRKRFQAETFVMALGRDIQFLCMHTKWARPVFSAFGVSLALTILWFPPYWNIQHPGTSEHIKSGLTKEGLAWIGSEDPELEIVEFTDYQCFQCRKMHLQTLQLLAHYPGKIRVIHRHFPMDHEFNPIVSEPTHIGSGHLAILAIHAAFKGKFSEMNDWLFFKAGVNQSSILLVEAGDATGIDARELAAALTHDRYRLLLKRDIHEGIRLGVVGTPSYLINGRVYEGNIPADILKPLLDVDL